MNVSIGGRVASTGSGKNNNTRKALAVGMAFLGFTIIGAGVWWWRKSDNSPEVVEDTSPNEITLNGLILEIAELDDEYEQGRLSAEAHQQLRQNLMRKAKRFL